MDEPVEQLRAADWTDQDLLTRDEACAKLEVEIATERARLAALPPAESTARERLGQRIADLEKAREILCGPRPL